MIGNVEDSGASFLNNEESCTNLLPDYSNRRSNIEAGQPLTLLLPDLEPLCDHDFAISGDSKKKALKSSIL